MFTIGEKDTSKKMSAAKVRIEMAKQFKFSQTLKETQIKGFFASLIKKQKNKKALPNDEDDDHQEDEDGDNQEDDDSYSNLLDDVQVEVYD